MNARYRVDLDQPERDELTAMLRGGKHPARKLKRAQILVCTENPIRVYRMIESAKLAR